MKSLVCITSFLAVVLNGVSAKPVPGSEVVKKAPRSFSPRWKETKHLRPVLERRQEIALTEPPNKDSLTFEDGEPQNPETGYGDIIVGE